MMYSWALFRDWANKSTERFDSTRKISRRVLVFLASVIKFEGAVIRQLVSVVKGKLETKARKFSRNCRRDQTSAAVEYAVGGRINSMLS